ncbi:hypothetical protein BBO99_00001543 [Phytophthora kernoviae]|uniref:RING-type E3 ubiquitin transferase n=1 Tax=Phytophthora kernoviae TaxID=325452 RepID=A0A421GZL1_9STRA|nr:hypothetical protein JM16_001075 [Phytophthora kernoviae]RLN20296.1 hypothetical protein BBI17_001366 [Phytophthora kernoviae]RLN84175.1 hypothetical protein BBO99_00001543 [Phytophthora kernoviae]
MRRSNMRESAPAAARNSDNVVLGNFQHGLPLQETEQDYEEKRGVPLNRSTRQNSTPGVSPATLCRFFVLGKCRYGSHCTFSHALPAQVSECASNEAEGLLAAAALVDCPFFLRGNCKYGEHCRLRHDPATLSASGAARTSPPVARSSTMTNGTRSNSAAASSPSDNQQDFTCGICFDDIVESGKHFGLLGCDHCFCLDCLRSWRQSKEMEVEVIRACPACRIPSDFIVPSLVFCTGEAKRQVVEAYKSHLALRECKYFNGLFGSCPFGQHCFYAHRDSEGHDVKHLDRPKRSTKPRRGNRNGNQGGDAALQNLLQQYSRIFRFFEVADWDDFDLVGGFDSDDSDDDDFDYEYGFSDDDYDTD